MSARTCPKCQRELPVEILRALEQGTACPHCATRLKRTPRRAPAAASGDNEYADFQVSQTPSPAAPPTDGDSYRWFQNKASPGVPAPAAAAPPRSPLKPLPAVAMPGLTPSTARTPEPPRPAPAPSPPAPPPAAPIAAARTTAPAPPATEVAKRPPPREAAPPAPPEARRAPTIVGTAPPAPVERPSSPPVRSPIVQSPSVPAPLAEPPRAPLAMTAVLPAGGSTLALAAAPLAFPLRARRNVGIVVGTATVTVAVALLLSHRSPSHHPAPLAGGALPGSPATGSVPVALPEASGTPAIQPLRAEPHTAAGPAAPAPTIGHAGGDAARGAAEGASARAQTKVRVAHHAAAHERRYAKHDKHAKRARHERRSARQTAVASRATPASGDDSDARASYQRGNALLFAGDAAGAVAAYRKAVELAPRDPIGYRGLGLAYEQQGGTAAAIRALRKYLKLAPGAADREIISRRIAGLSQGAGHP